MTWQQTYHPPRLGPNAIHLWKFPLRTSPSLLPQLQTLLSPEEITRAERLLRPADGQRYRVGRVRLRQLLGRYLGEPPLTLPLTTRPHGKPVLAHSSLAFNLSHSGDQALLAVAWERDLGVDLEKIEDNLDWLPLARRCFTPAELQALNRLPSTAQRSAFYAVWTRKEAWLKAVGTGLLLAPTSIETAVPPAAAALLTLPPAYGLPTDWHLQDLPLEPLLRGTLAYRGERAELVLLQFPLAFPLEEEFAD